MVKRYKVVNGCLYFGDFGKEEGWSNFSGKVVRESDYDALQSLNAELLALLEESRRTFEMWKDVAPAVSLCADIDKALANARSQA